MTTNIRQRESSLVLVVDDDRTIRMLAQQALQINGFAVLEAQNGSEALELFARHAPDVVLLDVNMPGIDGYETCREIRQLPFGANVPILMMTGMDDLESINHAYEAGATDFIGKPINWFLLGHRMRYLIRATQLGEELIKNREKLFAAQRIAKLGWWEWNIKENMLTCSPDAARLFNIDPVGFKGTAESLLCWVHPEDRPALFDAMEKLRLEGGNFSVDHRIMAAAGTEQYVQHHVEATVDIDGTISHLLGTVQDITQRKNAEDRIRYLAYYDNLTGLPNRPFFLDRLNLATEQARRHKKNLAVVFLDLDDFKKVNDTMGHSVGDLLLKEVSVRLKNVIRRTDTLSHPGGLIARFGGDEFVILLTDLEAGHDAARVAERFIRAMLPSFMISNQEIFITVSMGIGVFPGDGEDAETLLRNADTAMYHAKEGGRNAYQFYTKSMNEQAMRLLVLENNLRRAISGNELLLHYQPKIDLATGGLSGVEALVRWQKPEEGLIPPGVFIPIAEDNGLIVPIGKWILQEACRQHKKWREQGLPPIRIAVNVSGRQFLEEDFIETVRTTLAQSGIDPHYLDIEVTESVIMKGVENQIRNLTELKKLGIRLSLDDFGTGYSSLNYLVRFPLDHLKIDRSFLLGMLSNSSHRSVTIAIIALAKKLQMKVIAEGVETIEQLDFLRQQDCDEAQGFMFARPIQPDEIAAIVRNGAQKGYPWSEFFP